MQKIQNMHQSNFFYFCITQITKYTYTQLPTWDARERFCTSVRFILSVKWIHRQSRHSETFTKLRNLQRIVRMV